MITDNFPKQIQELKSQVKAMLSERAALGKENKTAFSSPIWTEALSVFTYLMNLSEEDFKNIRFHTGLINGGSWAYWHPYPIPDPVTTARGLGYTALINNLPESYWIGEPPTPGIPRPLGVTYKGKIINSNVVRFQQCISHLYHSGAFQPITEAKEKQFVVEIGGGYGALAHGIGGIFDKKITYINIDLPEMFLFSGAFLAVNNPGKSIYIYDSATFTPDFVQHKLLEYDFALIPNYALKQLFPLQDIALMINMQSFQEMNQQQVDEYLEFGAKRCRYVYSDNLDRHPYNQDLDSVTKILEKYYTLYPPAQYYDKLYKNTGAHWTSYYKKYIGVPLNSGIALKNPQALIPEVPWKTRLLKILIPPPLRSFIWSILRKLAGA